MTMQLRFSHEIYHSRGRRGLTQEQVAESLSISVRWYQEIESGRAIPSALLLLKIIALLEIDGKKLKEEV